MDAIPLGRARSCCLFRRKVKPEDHGTQHAARRTCWIKRKPVLVAQALCCLRSFVGKPGRTYIKRAAGGGTGRSGVGTGGYVVRSQSGSSSPRARRGVGRSAALASSRTMHRSRHPITIRMAPKAELTSDHLMIVPNARVRVDRSPVSFITVLSGDGEHSISSTDVPRLGRSRCGTFTKLRLGPSAILTG